MQWQIQQRRTDQQPTYYLLRPTSWGCPGASQPPQRRCSGWLQDHPKQQITDGKQASESLQAFVTQLNRYESISIHHVWPKKCEIFEESGGVWSCSPFWGCRSRWDQVCVCGSERWRQDRPSSCWREKTSSGWGWRWRSHICCITSRHYRRR